jgi:hypothetical protein
MQKPGALAGATPLGQWRAQGRWPACYDEGSAAGRAAAPSIMSLITLLLLLAIAATICFIFHVLRRDAMPLWVAVALLTRAVLSGLSHRVEVTANQVEERGLHVAPTAARWKWRGPRYGGISSAFQ